jgi:hypothetical protein
VSDTLLILGLGLLYPVMHTANRWLFSFAELSPNVALIYLPAFLRLLNVLMLGKLKGTLATLLGGFFLLLINAHDPLALKITHMLASAASPLLALVAFEHWRKRPVNLLSLSDLALVTLTYCLANSVIHHFLWAAFFPEHLGTPQQMLTMAVGDLTGALIGAYLLKWAAQRMGLGRSNKP